LTASFLLAVAFFTGGPARAQQPPILRYGLSIRERPELRTNPSFEREPELDLGEPADQYFVGSRLRATLSLDAPDTVRIFAQIQDARRFGTETGTTADEATLDVHQAYGELHGLWADRLDLRAGRLEMAYGSERLIGNADWLDPARAFDGGLAKVRATKRLSVDLFGAWVRERRVITRRDEAGSTVADATTGDGFVGTFAAWKLREKHELDGYVLARFDGPTNTPRLTERDRRIVSPGVRAAGAFGSLSYGAEGSVQVGKADGLCVDPCEIVATEHNDHFAWAFAVMLQYELPVPIKPFVGAELDMASGDGDPADGESREFDNFFPSNHPYYGTMDLIGWRNLRDLRLRAGVSPTGTVGLTVDVHLLGLQQRYGAWTDAAGNPMDDDDFDLYFATSRDLGTEVDLGATWQTPLPPLKAMAGFSAFVPGAAATERRGPATSLWGFVMLSAALEGSTAPPNPL
jgi:hypothetical protein